MQNFVEKTKSALKYLPCYLPFKGSYIKAKSDYLAGNYWYAYELMLQHCDKTPEDEKAWVLLGLCCDKLEQFEEGIGAFKQALCLEPSNTDSLYNLARLLVCVKQSSIALRYIEHSEFLLASEGLVDDELMYLKAIAQEESADFEGALATLDALSQSDLNTRRFRAELNMHMGQYEEAVEALTLFLSEEAGDMGALTSLCICLSKLERWTELEMHAKNILSQDPENTLVSGLLAEANESLV